MESLASVSLPLQSSNYDLAGLSAQARSGQPHAVDQVAHNFESMFLSEILKQMRQTLEKGTLFGEDSGDVYGGLFDLFLGQHLAQSGGIGIAAMLKRQLESSTKP